jgi:hypothetical protein
MKNSNLRVVAPEAMLEPPNIDHFARVMGISKLLPYGLKLLIIFRAA